MKQLKQVSNSFGKIIFNAIRNMNTNITYTNTLAIEDYTMFRKIVGWQELSERQIEISLKNSTSLIVAMDGTKPIGMARTITDGGYFVLLVDVIVLPEYQKTGIGRELMTRLMTGINENINENETVCVSLMAATGKEEFYEKFGFTKRPNAEQGAGMMQYIKK